MKEKYIAWDRSTRIFISVVTGVLLFPIFALIMWISMNESGSESARDSAACNLFWGSILVIPFITTTLLVNPIANRLPGKKIWHFVLRIPAYALYIFLVLMATRIVVRVIYYRILGN